MKKSGFSVVSIVLIIVTVGLLGVAGWYVWQENRTKTSNAVADNGRPANSQDQEGIPLSLEEENVIKINELGIQLTAPDYMTDLVYKIEMLKTKDGKDAPVAYFSTKSIVESKLGCSLVDTSFGSLARVEGKYPSAGVAEQDLEAEYGQLIKQFPEFYITISFPNGGGDCQVYPEPSFSVEDGWRAALRNAASSAEELVY